MAVAFISPGPIRLAHNKAGQKVPVVMVTTAAPPVYQASISSPTIEISKNGAAYASASDGTWTEVSDGDYTITPGRRNRHLDANASYLHRERQMSNLIGTDLEQIAIFKRIVTMLQAGIGNIEKLAHKRDVAIGLTDLAEVYKANGREVGDKILEQMVDPDDLNAQIIHGIQSMRRVVVGAVRDIGNVKNAAMNGVAHVPAPVEPQPVAPVAVEPPNEDELGEELELTEEE